MDIMKITFAFLWLIGILMLPCFGSHEFIKEIITDVRCNYTGMMTVMDLESSFSGSIYTMDHYFNPVCRYDVSPRTTNTSLSFFFPANTCGSLIEELDGHIYFSNMIVIQKYRVVQTLWDVVRNVSCKVPMPKALELASIFGHGTRSEPFKLDDVESWMEFAVGSDICTAKPANTLRVGNEFLLAVYLKDGGINNDMKVSSCWAHDKEMVSYSKHVTHILDVNLCKPSAWISEFKLVASTNKISDKIIYANMKAFKFSSTIDFYITCSIEVCTDSCISYCDLPASSRNNHIIPSRKLQKRSAVAGNSNRSNEERVRLLKATIKALGVNILQNRRERSESENSASFYKRISNPTSPKLRYNDGEVTEMPSDKSEVATASEMDASTFFKRTGSTSGYGTDGDVTTEYHFEPSWNSIYNFNLTTKVIMLSSKQITDRNAFDALKLSFTCIPNNKLVLVAAALSTILFCALLACVAFCLWLRKEKKKQRANNFLMYSFI